MGEILERKDALTATTMEIQLVKPRITAGQTSNYIVDWFEASTGREPYAPLETLATAAFLAMERKPQVGQSTRH
jgi:hypothetical protein